MDYNTVRKKILIKFLKASIESNTLINNWLLDLFASSLWTKETLEALNSTYTRLSEKISCAEEGYTLEVKFPNTIYIVSDETIMEQSCLTSEIPFDIALELLELKAEIEARLANALKEN